MLIKEKKVFIVHLFFRVEDRNDPMVHKIRRYIGAFAKDDDQAKDKQEPQKTDTSADELPGEAPAKVIMRGGANLNRRSLWAWQKIRQSTLFFDTEKDSHYDDGQEVQYV